MVLLRELMSDWVGVLSLITILAVLAMAGYYGWLFSRKVAEDTLAHANPSPRRRQRRV